MKNVIVKFIKHSSFIVETGSSYFLFDYIGGELPELDKNKKIYVFATHNHYDHYQKVIFDIFDNDQDVSYILSDDITKEMIGDVDYENILFVSPNNEYELDELKITTLKSTDQGVAYFIENEECNIYHAGDLNDWSWPGQNFLVNNLMDNLYLKEIGLLKGKFVDVAFVPLDPRLEENYHLGMSNFLRVVKPKYLFPMHMWEDYSVCNLFKNDFADLLKDVNFLEINREEEQFILKGE